MEQILDLSGGRLHWSRVDSDVTIITAQTLTTTHCVGRSSAIDSTNWL